MMLAAIYKLNGARFLAFLPWCRLSNHVHICVSVVDVQAKRLTLSLIKQVSGEKEVHHVGVELMVYLQLSQEQPPVQVQDEPLPVQPQSGPFILMVV